jgi:hypothetical protein
MGLDGCEQLRQTVTPIKRKVPAPSLHHFVWLHSQAGELPLKGACRHERKPADLWQGDECFGDSHTPYRECQNRVNFKLQSGINPLERAAKSRLRISSTSPAATQNVFSILNAMNVPPFFAILIPPNSDNRRSMDSDAWTSGASSEAVISMGGDWRFIM